MIRCPWCTNDKIVAAVAVPAKARESTNSKVAETTMTPTQSKNIMMRKRNRWKIRTLNQSIKSTAMILKMTIATTAIIRITAALTTTM